MIYYFGLYSCIVYAPWYRRGCYFLRSLRSKFTAKHRLINKSKTNKIKQFCEIVHKPFVYAVGEHIVRGPFAFEMTN